MLLQGIISITQFSGFGHFLERIFRKGRFFVMVDTISITIPVNRIDGIIGTLLFSAGELCNYADDARRTAQQFGNNEYFLSISEDVNDLVNQLDDVRRKFEDAVAVAVAADGRDPFTYRKIEVA